MNPAASHTDYHIAEQLLEPYLQNIFQWTTANELKLNPDKSTATLFTPDPAEYDTKLNLTINNILIPTVKNPKILESYIRPKTKLLRTRQNHQRKSRKEHQNPQSTYLYHLGKQKETLLSTYKTIIRPVIEYANTIWSPIISDTNLQKLQTIQNTALRVITGCTSDTSIQHLHDETKTLPLNNHLKLHALQLRHKTNLPSHPLHPLTSQTECPRRMKLTIFTDPSYNPPNTNLLPQHTTTDQIKQNLKTIHCTTVQEYLDSRKPNTKTTPP